LVDLWLEREYYTSQFAEERKKLNQARKTVDEIIKQKQAVVTHD